MARRTDIAGSLSFVSPTYFMRPTRCARESAELAIALNPTRPTRCARESAELAIALKLPG